MSSSAVARARIKNGSRWFDIFNVVLMVLLCIIMLLPLMRVIALSFSEPSAVTKGKVGFWPIGFNLKAYEVILTDPILWEYFKNTIVYTVLGTLASVGITSLTAYPLSVPGFVAKKPLTILLTITMFFSGGLIPTYICFVSMGAINSLWVMIFPGCLTAYNTFVYRSFFSSIPGELRESAYIDGANDLIIFVKIIIPLSTALFATYGLFAAVQYWNLWFKAMIYLHDTSKYPVQMLLRKLIIVEQLSLSEGTTTEIAEMISAQAITPRGTQMAAVMIVMLPILFVYPFAQKFFVKGVMVGSIKG